MYPLSVITARARIHQDQLVSGDLHETYYQVMLGYYWILLDTLITENPQSKEYWYVK